MALEFLVLNDQKVMQIMNDARFQTSLPGLKSAANLYASANSGCCCNSGKRRREAVSKAKTYLMEAPLEGKIKIKTLLNAKKVRISGVQGGKPRVIEF